MHSVYEVCMHVCTCTCNYMMCICQGLSAHIVTESGGKGEGPELAHVRHIMDVSVK